MQRTAARRRRWEYYAYQWWDGDAELLPLETRVAVNATSEDGQRFKHEIPSRYDCRTCHESNPTIVIGFDELRLNTKIAGGSQKSQLLQLAAAGIFTQAVPEQPAEVTHPDERTREVLGYLQGNCVHCHNSAPVSMSGLDLSYPHALSNLIGVATQESAQAAGLRVLPGAPDQSIFYLAVSGAQGIPNLQTMPPVGVQRRDERAIKLLRDWILALPD